MHRNLFAGLAAAAFLVCGPALADVVVDPTGDFVGGFTGAHNGELDITGASATVTGSNLLLSVNVNGTLGAAPGELYVFGIDRGAGIPRFGIPFAFDALAVLFPDGVGRAVTFPTAGAPTITVLPGAVTVSGSTISGLFPLSLYPTSGAPLDSYNFVVWSRLRVDPAADGLIGEIADYVPNTGGFHAAVPEPGVWAMLISGFGLIGARLRRRRAAWLGACC